MSRWIHHTYRSIICAKGQIRDWKFKTPMLNSMFFLLTHSTCHRHSNRFFIRFHTQDGIENKIMKFQTDINFQTLLQCTSHSHSHPHSQTQFKTTWTKDKLNLTIISASWTEQITSTFISIWFIVFAFPLRPLSRLSIIKKSNTV